MTVRNFAIWTSVCLTVVSFGVGTAFAGIGAEQQGQLSAPQPESRAFLGQAVAVQGDTAVVGSPGRDVDGNTRAGSLFVYTYDGSSWTRQQELTSSNPERDAFFGRSVAIDGDTLVVGQSSVGGESSVHMFTRSGGTWSRQQIVTIDEPDISPEPALGLEVALEGDTALVGAPLQRGDNSIAGFVYVFTRSNGSWSQTQRLSASDAGARAQFGDSISLDGDLAVIGAPAADSSVDGAGAAYSFQKSGGTWTQQQKLTSPDPKEYAYFGSDVSLDGSKALVGARSPFAYEPARPGAAYLFAQSGGTWNLTEHLSACDGSEDDQFGRSVALGQDLALVGASGAEVRPPMGRAADDGAVYAYTPQGGSWNHADKFFNESADNFGTTLARDGQRVVVGDPDFIAQPEDGEVITQAGQAFAFSIDPTSAGGGETVCDGDSNGDTGIGSDAGPDPRLPDYGSGCSTSGQAPSVPYALLVLVGLGMIGRRE
jgi:MYXO-CTERM domain-containing protein